MLIEDHINFVGMAGVNPLRGPNLDEFGPRFPAVNRTYTLRLRQLAEKVASAQGLRLQKGVYAVLSGPNFESPAEIRMLRMLGIDAVGMSTVPEALVAHHAGIDVLALSTITNVAVADLDAGAEPSHEEVIDAGKSHRAKADGAAAGRGGRTVRRDLAMSFLKNLFGGQRLDGAALVESQDLKEYAQIDLLAQFDPPQALHDTKEQARWSRVLPRPYADEIALFQKQGWLEKRPGGTADGTYAVTAAAMPYVRGLAPAHAGGKRCCHG